MKLRYMREQRDRAREMLNQKDQEIEDRKNAQGATSLSAKTSRKRTKFQLDSDSDGDNNDVFMGFTHKGKRLDVDADKDDFNEDISQESDDDKNDRKNRKGFLTEDMVNQMNFGGGEEVDDEGAPKVKKTRKEVFQEIMEKSKNYDAARKELKQINLKMVNELEEDYHSLIDKLKYSGAPVDARSKNQELLDKISGSKTKAKEKELTYE